MVPASASKVTETNDNIPPLAMLNSTLPQKMVHDKMVTNNCSRSRPFSWTGNVQDLDRVTRSASAHPYAACMTQCSIACLFASLSD